MNTDEPGGIAGTKKQKNKSPRTHLSQVWIPAFRLPWVRSRLKPELRTSPQRRGERPKILCFLQKDFVASSCLRGGCGFAALCSSVVSFCAKFGRRTLNFLLTASRYRG